MGVKNILFYLYLFDIRRLYKVAVSIFICNAFLSLPIFAKDPNNIPKREAMPSGYLSVNLLVDPCLEDLSSLNKDDMITVKDIQKKLPPETCNNKALADKLYQANFLYYTSLTMSNAPWVIHEKITPFHKKMYKCKTTQCLNSVLDSILDRLKPIYVSLKSRDWSQISMLCDQEPIDMDLEQHPRILRQRISKQVGKTCEDRGFAVQQCHGKLGQILFVSCKPDGNYPNVAEWINQLQHQYKIKQIAFIDDGPVKILETSCYGRPDLMATERINLVEHYKIFYRYNGKSYSVFYQYTEEDYNGFAVAQFENYYPIVCK